MAPCADILEKAAVSLEELSEGIFYQDPLDWKALVMMITIPFSTALLGFYSARKL
jgi:hypothetical protein